MSILAQVYPSGITSIHESANDLTSLVDAIVSRHTHQPSSLILVFYCPLNYNGERLVQKLSEVLPDTNCCGCSSSGEVTPDGLDSGGVISLLFPANRFCAASTLLQSINDLGLEEIVHEVAQLKDQLETQTITDSQQQASTTDTLSNTDEAVFAISLIDGLSYSEESITSALKIGLGEIPLIGGSAGDSMQFMQTTQFCNNTIGSNSAVLILLRTSLTFETFTNRNFLPTEQKFVVTESNPDSRTVYEFNAEPAALAYATALGLSINELTPAVFASNPVVLRVGGELYCRSIQKVNDDHSVTFFCAIDNGIVLTLAKSTGMVASTREMLSHLSVKLGGIDMILGFDCVLRRLDASNRGVNESISLIYRDHNVVGFGTYGEQFNSMHLNQTFTGIAFSKQESSIENSSC